MSKALIGELLIPVYYEDTDFSGYVFHANYVKYFDRAREELLGRIVLRNMFEKGKHFVVKDMHIQFHKPARHGDVMRVHSRLEFDHAAIVKCHHTVFKQENDEKLVTGYTELVTVNERGFPIRVPTELLP